MKKMNSAYRLKIIKEVATRRRLTAQDDPMANHISQLLDLYSAEGAHAEPLHFNGSHYDERIGGWVSNFWDMK